MVVEVAGRRQLAEGEISEIEYRSCGSSVMYGSVVVGSVCER